MYTYTLLHSQAVLHQPLGRHSKWLKSTRNRRVKYLSIPLSAHSFARTAHSFARSFIRSLAHSAAPKLMLGFIEFSHAQATMAPHKRPPRITCLTLTDSRSSLFYFFPREVFPRLRRSFPSRSLGVALIGGASFHCCCRHCFHWSHERLSSEFSRWRQLMTLASLFLPKFSLSLLPLRCSFFRRSKFRSRNHGQDRSRWFCGRTSFFP